MKLKVLVIFNIIGLIYGSQEYISDTLYIWSGDHFIASNEKLLCDVVTIVPVYKNFEYNSDMITSNAKSVGLDNKHRHILHLRIDDHENDIKSEIASIERTLKSLECPTNFKISIITNGENKGIFHTRNKLMLDVLDYFAPQFITWMDSDDVKQISCDSITMHYMEKKHNCFILYLEKTMAIVNQDFSYDKAPRNTYQPESFSINTLGLDTSLDYLVPITMRYNMLAWKLTYQNMVEESYECTSVEFICQTYNSIIADILFNEGQAPDTEQLSYALYFNTKNCFPLSFYRQHKNSDMHKELPKRFTIDYYKGNEELLSENESAKERCIKYINRIILAIEQNKEFYFVILPVLESVTENLEELKNHHEIEITDKEIIDRLIYLLNNPLQ
ncbi:MAG: hypothetical protein IJ481_00830 [Alphaproteobacteria bacterium]|nr:hypothetical protein [Alphaproteobacteria bacterium]